MTASADQASRQPSLLLASTSRTRQVMLQAAGLTFDVAAPHVDEDRLKRQLLAEDPPATPDRVAAMLAEAKALAVAGLRPQVLTIGADQVLDLDGEILSKPPTMAEARVALLRLRGRDHRLVSAVALAAGPVVLWRHVEHATLRMRPFSEAFVDDYLAAVGVDALQSVGSYQIEGRGAQLFEHVNGDHFTILGLPLLPLLAELRHRGVLEA